MKAERFVDKAGQTLGYFINCPGCKAVHCVYVEGPVKWSFNGDIDKPTFQPSLLVRGGHHIPGHIGKCWCDYRKEHPETTVKFDCGICHSFITDGRIQFLSDCTHALAGQTVDLLDMSDSD